LMLPLSNWGAHNRLARTNNDILDFILQNTICYKYALCFLRCGEVTRAMTRLPHILLVEDDRSICSLLSRFLTEGNCRVLAVHNGREMDKALEHAKIDLIVLDIMLPGEDGLSICKRLRQSGNIPIIMLTAKSEQIDKVVGLELGADDYLSKPFNPHELLARIRAVLRRGAFAKNAPEFKSDLPLFFSGWSLTIQQRKLSNPTGAQVILTTSEFDLLSAFCAHQGQVLSRDKLLDLTHGRVSGPFERSIDVLVSRLRQKIELNPAEPELIKTVRASGYVFTAAITQ
jgi:two-component system, OmpR family, response regulator